MPAMTQVGIEVDKKLRYKQLNANFQQQQNLPDLTSLIHGDAGTAAVQQQTLATNSYQPYDVILTGDAGFVTVSYVVG